MKLSLTHTLNFSLGTPARAVQHVLLTALATPQQKIERWAIAMPGFADAATFRDGYGNKAHLVSQVKPEPEISVTVTGTVETTDRAGVLGRLEFDPPPALFRRPTDLVKPDATLLDGLDRKAGRIALLHELMGRIHAGLAAPETAVATQSQSQTQGAAQSQEQGQVAAPVRPDAAVHAFLAAARAADIPARYVTGYLWNEGAGSFHAWAEAWDDGLGWIGFDPLLDVCPADLHIRLASGLDATATMPLRSAPPWPEMPVETVEIVEG